MGRHQGRGGLSGLQIPVSRVTATRLLIHDVDPDLAQAWQQNLWFEEYVAGLLWSLEWKIWTHVHVLGMSGILHEIDVLAIKKSFIICVECKTGKVAREDVFNFSIKMSDLKAHIGVLAFLRQLPEPETRKFVQKNPGLVVLENLGEKQKAGILDEIKSTVLGRI